MFCSCCKFKRARAAPCCRPLPLKQHANCRHNPCLTLFRDAATQVASRLFILWGIVDLVPQAHSRPLVVAQWGQAYVELSLLSLLVAWCCSEVIRYSFFAFKVRPSAPGRCSMRTVARAGSTGSAEPPWMEQPGPPLYGAAGCDCLQPGVLAALR